MVGSYCVNIDISFRDPQDDEKIRLFRRYYSSLRTQSPESPSGNYGSKPSHCERKPVPISEKDIGRRDEFIISSFIVNPIYVLDVPLLCFRRSITRRRVPQGSCADRKFHTSLICLQKLDNLAYNVFIHRKALDNL